jgi:hypothetical protein
MIRKYLGYLRFFIVLVTVTVFLTTNLPMFLDTLFFLVNVAIKLLVFKREL